MKEFKDKYPIIINQYKNTLQDSIWHSEGNVFIHTAMVLNALEVVEGIESLSSEDLDIVRYAAFFHDYGKIKTTMVENGRIISPNHSRVGAKMFFELAYKEGIPFNKRKDIYFLILLILN